MINHARTLLLNIPSTRYQPGTLGEEYIPQYYPVDLPSYLLLPQRILFGTNPDKVFLNFRAHELLSFIHQTELAEFVYALDPRVTYWPKASTDFFTAQRQLNLNKLSGSRISRLFITGAVKPDNIVGRAYRNYSVGVASVNGSQRLTITADSTPKKLDQELNWLSSTMPSTMALTSPTPARSGLSTFVPLFDSDLRIQVSTPSLTLPVLLLEDYAALLKEDFYEIELESGEDINAPMPLRKRPRLGLIEDQLLSQWTLEVYSRPDSAISVCLPRLEFLGEPFYLRLFGVGNKTQPYATFKNIWFDHPNPAYRVAAFALAMIYRTEELRSGNG
jgi:hypothetical protein